LARNGSGTYVRVMDWTNDRDSGQNISASRMDTEFDDIATALSDSIAKNGETTITANLPMANFRHTGVGNASARTDYAAYGQLQDSSPQWGGSATQTATNYSITLTPAVTTLVAGLTVRFSAGQNDGPMTLTVNGTAAKNLYKRNGKALAKNDILGGVVTATYDGSQFILQSVDAVTYRADCRLVYTNATTLTLNRKNGDRLCINGVNEQIPSAGVTLSNGGLSADTTYFIYAYMSGGTMALEASTTGHAEDSTTGMEIKSGAATRTLVGMARTNASSQFVQSSSNLGVITYFNRRLKSIKASFTADRTTTSTSYAELNSEIRLPFIMWIDGDVAYAVRGTTVGNTVGAASFTAVGIDTSGTVNIRGGTASEQPGSVASQGLNSSFSGFTDESEGYHYATIMGKVTAGTGTWNGGSVTAERDITLSIAVLG
jgi:hypothetical protein